MDPDGSRARWRLRGAAGPSDDGPRRRTWREGADRRLLRALTRPVRLVPLSFLAVITVGTALLSLPISQTGGGSDVLAAAFQSVSAVCVTGLVSVDTPTFWTPFGQVVLVSLAQIGGFGIMTLATLLSLLVRGRLGVSGQLRVRAETHAFDLGGSVTGLVRGIAVRVLLIEGLVALLLTIRFRWAYDDDLGRAAWHGGFHAVSAFNNAGFAHWSDSFITFVSDPFICLPLCLAVVLGGIGYPVLFEVGQRWRRPSSWTVHTRLTVGGSLVLFLLGGLAYLAFEGSNPATMGPLSWPDKVLAAGTASVFARSAGLSTIDFGHITSVTLLITLVLMFIGGGSAGTAGGIRVSTFFLLGFAILAEARGERDVVIGRRRVGTAAVRQALAVALLGVGMVTVGTITVVSLTGEPLDDVVFEVISAFATVGLSTGITPELNPAGQIVIMALMFIGRAGTVTLASALALRSRQRHFHYPEESPLVG